MRNHGYCFPKCVYHILGIILHLRTVIQINIIYICLGKRETGSSPLYPIMGFGEIVISVIQSNSFIPGLYILNLDIPDLLIFSNKCI